MMSDYKNVECLIIRHFIKSKNRFCKLKTKSLTALVNRLAGGLIVSESQFIQIMEEQGYQKTSKGYYLMELTPFALRVAKSMFIKYIGYE